MGKQIKEPELRAYFFQNMYLSGLQAGLQSQHTTAEMFVKYNSYAIAAGGGKSSHIGSSMKKIGMLYSWASDHKTTIILNGGYSSNLQKIVDLLEDSQNPMPFNFFHETEDALNGALTNVGVIVSDRYWKVKVEEAKRSNHFTLTGINYTEWEFKFMEVLQGCRLIN